MSKSLIFSKKNNLSNQKKIFTDSWLLLNKKNISNFEVISHLKSNKIKIEDFKYVKKIYSNCTKKLTIALNKFHQKNYKQKEWEILIFFFLSNYIFWAYERWKIIKKIKNKNKLLPVEVFSFSKNSFITQDSLEFHRLAKTNNWNDWLYSKIIEAQKINLKKKKIKIKKNIKVNKKNLVFLKIINFFLPTNKDQYFLKNLFLPRVLNIRLKFNLKIKLRIFNNLKLNNIKEFSNKRKIIGKIYSKDKFENFIYKTLPEIMPVNYLENFNLIENNLKLLNWPINPKIIFTSYDHYHNDIFKIYTINKIRNKCKFYILQHGHQGHHDLCSTFYEKKICSKYFTWGNTSKNKNIIPLFCTSTLGKNIKKKIKRDILITYTDFFLKPWRSTTVPKSLDDVNLHTKDILDLLTLLHEKKKYKISMKYFSGGEKYITNKIKKKFNNIDLISTDLKKRGFSYSNKFKLCIETINSTGFIELLSLNIPVILITNKKFFQVTKENKIYYDKLIESNIIFFDLKKAERFIKLNIDCLDDWWLNEDTQKNIKFFCDNLCKYEKNFNRGLNQLVNKLSLK